MPGTSVLFCHKSAVGHFITPAASYFKDIKKEKSQYSAESSWHQHTMWLHILQCYHWNDEATLHIKFDRTWQNSKKIIVNRMVGISGGVKHQSQKVLMNLKLWQQLPTKCHRYGASKQPIQILCKKQPRKVHNALTTKQEEPLTQELSLQIHCTQSPRSSFSLSLLCMWIQHRIQSSMVPYNSSINGTG